VSCACSANTARALHASRVACCPLFPPRRQVHEVANPWGAEVPVRAALDPRGREGPEVVVEATKPKHLPPGSAVSHTWCALEKGLRCAMEVRRGCRREERARTCAASRSRWKASGETARAPSPEAASGED